MRLYEIENVNLIYAKYQGIDLTLDIDKKFKFAMGLLSFLNKTNDQQQNANMIPILNQNEHIISSVIDPNWPDMADPDIINLTNKATKMLVDLASKRNKLKF